jgi:serine/threonine protein kinase
MVKLNSGTFATVCRGKHRITGDRVAVKCVLRKDLHIADDAAIYDEVAVLSSLDHLHITSIIDFFEEPDCYYIVMELMSGGDLFDRIGKKKSYSEADARDLVVKMMKAVAICHQNNIAHCDIKPKNLLLASDMDDSFIKLADFGFATRVYKPKSLTKQCGTPFFVAPEILARKPYDMSADIWSAGCIVFLLLSGNLPFKGRNQKELFKSIMKGDFEFNPKEWEGVSDEAKDFVSKMLVRNQDDRTTARKALLHPWLQADERRLSKHCLNSTSQRLKTFNAKMKLRSAMIAVDVVSALKRVAVTSNSSHKSFNSSASASVTTCATSVTSSSH